MGTTTVHALRHATRKLFALVLQSTAGRTKRKKTWKEEELCIPPFHDKTNTYIPVSAITQSLTSAGCDVRTYTGSSIGDIAVTVQTVTSQTVVRENMLNHYL